MSLFTGSHPCVTVSQYRDPLHVNILIVKNVIDVSNEISHFKMRGVQNTVCLNRYIGNYNNSS